MILASDDIVTSPASRRTESGGTSLRDLFTRDVTHEAMHDLVRRDVSDAWRYFRRDIDRAALQPDVWYKRWTIGLWNTFLAIAFRLSPARRSLFALAALFLVLSWLRYGVEATLSWFVSPPSWGLLSATVLFLLLALELRTSWRSAATSRSHDKSSSACRRRPPTSATASSSPPRCSPHIWSSRIGVTEALDREEREYGEAHLAGLLDNARALAAVELVRRVEADVIAHCGGARQYDDITLLAIARDTPASIGAR